MIGPNANSNAWGINNAGTVVGESDATGGLTHAFSYTGTTMTDLGALVAGGNSVAFGINNNGVIVGSSSTSSGVTNLFTYSGGVMTNRGNLGGNDTWGLAINLSGTAVGYYISGGSRRAMVYDGTTISDLNSLVDSSGAAWTLQQANALNDSGWIVGYGLIGGATHGFLLTTVPEPSEDSLEFCGCCLLLCAMMRRRQKKLSRF